METVLTDFLTPAELASELRVCQRTLDRWNMLGEGPPRVTVGRRVLYRRSSITAWLASREQQTCSERRENGDAS
jgi:predicted DNA-binding transcriptional regulator AlpA